MILKSIQNIHPVEIISFLTALGCGIAGYKVSEIALYLKVFIPM